MILGAGRGTRLQALGLDVPKILVDVRGRPLLERQLTWLAGQGVQRAVVNVHHRAEQVREFAARYDGPVELVLSEEPELLGTAGGVRRALPLLDSEQIMVIYGDVLFDLRLAPLIDAHLASGADATVTVYESDSAEGKGTIDIDEDGRITAFREKGEASERRPFLINGGLYVLGRAFVRDRVADGAVSDFGHDVFPDALRAGSELRVFLLDEPVLDIGTPDALREAQT